MKKFNKDCEIKIKYRFVSKARFDAQNCHDLEILRKCQVGANFHCLTGDETIFLHPAKDIQDFLKKIKFSWHEGMDE